MRGIKDDAGELVPKLKETIKTITGVDIMKDENTFKSTYDIIREISMVWKDISDTKRATLTEVMFGKNQGAVGAGLMNNFDIALKATETAINSAGSAAEEQAKYMDSIGARINTLSETIIEKWNKAISTDLIKGVVSGVTALVDTFGNLASVVGVATTALLIFKGQAIKNSITSMIGYQMALASTTASVGTLTIAEALLAGVTSTLKVAFKGLTVAIATNPIGAIAVGVTLAVGALALLTNHAKKAKEELIKFNEETTSKVKETASNIKEVESLLAKNEELQSKLSNTSNQQEHNKLKEEQLSIQKQIGELMPSAISDLDAEGKGIASNNEIIKEQIELKKQEMILTAQNFINDNKNIKQKIDNYRQLKEEVKELQIAQAQGKTKITKEVLGYDEMGREKTVEVEINVAKALKDKNKQMQDTLTLMGQYNTHAQTLNKFNNDNVQTYSLETDKINDNTKAKQNNSKATQQEIYNAKKTSESLNEATQSIEGYNQILKELDEGKGLTSGTMQKIIKDYPELISYLGSESDLRKAINNLINDEVDIQKQAFKTMMENDETYYKNKIANNVELQNKLNELVGGFVDENGKAYKLDFANFKTLAELKVAVLKDINEQIQRLHRNMISGDDMMVDPKLDMAVRRAEGRKQAIESSFDKWTFDYKGYDAIKNASGNLKGGSGSSKDTSNLTLQLSLYQDIEKAISDVNYALDRNKQKQENATGQELINLRKEEIALLEKQKNAYDELWKAKVNRRDSIRTELANGDFTFDDVGNITNLNQNLKIWEDWANSKTGTDKEKAIERTKKLEEATKEYLELISKGIPDANKQWYELANSIIKVGSEVTKLEIQAKDKELESITKPYTNRDKDLDLIGKQHDDIFSKIGISSEKLAIAKAEVKQLEDYLDKLNQIVPETVEGQEELTKKIEDTWDALRDKKGEVADREKSFKSLQDEAISIVEKTQNQITDIIKREVEKRKKLIDDEYNKKKEALQKERDLYNKQNDSDDYNKQLKKEQSILNEIKSKIASASMDTSLAGQTRLRDLKQQELEQQEKIDDLILERTRKTNNDRFDEQEKLIDKQKDSQFKMLDEVYSEENIRKMASEAILKGYFKGINGEIINVVTEFNKFEDEFGSGISTISDKLKNEFIAGLKEAQSILKGLGGIDILFGSVPKVQGVPSYDVGTPMVNGDQLAKIHDKEAILPKSINPFLGGASLSRFNSLFGFNSDKLPKIQQSNKETAVNFTEPFIVIQGNVTEEVFPRVERMVNNAKTEIFKAFRKGINDSGIYGA